MLHFKSIPKSVKKIFRALFLSKFFLMSERKTSQISLNTTIQQNLLFIDALRSTLKSESRQGKCSQKMHNQENDQAKFRQLLLKFFY